MYYICLDCGYEFDTDREQDDLREPKCPQCGAVDYAIQPTCSIEDYLSFNEDD